MVDVLDMISFLNNPLPGDPQGIRGVIVMLVMVVAFLWTQGNIRHWSTRDRRTKRVIPWLTAVLILNGFALLASAQRDDPIRVITALLGVVFVGLSIALLLRLPGDNSTQPVYPHLYPLALWKRATRH